MTRQSLSRHPRRYGRELGKLKATIYLLVNTGLYSSGEVNEVCCVSGQAGRPHLLDGWRAVLQVSCCSRWHRRLLHC
jgi:hypothetical protein